MTFHKLNKSLWGRVQIPTDGIVHDPHIAADLVKFQNRR